MEIRVSLLANGTILVGDEPADLTKLDTIFSRADRTQTKVRYYKESHDEASNRLSMSIVQLVLKHKLAVGLSSKPDFSDYIDQFGKSHPLPQAGTKPSGLLAKLFGSPGTPDTAGVPDKFAPFMPDVHPDCDPEAVFEQARTAVSKLTDRRGVVLVGPDRSVMVLPVPPRSPNMDSQVPKFPGLEDRPHRIAVISATGILGAFGGKTPDLRDAGKAIPFLGVLIGLRYGGHNVWIFEGHATALAAGLRSSEVLIVDSGMLPFLQPDWKAIAQKVMDEPRLICVQDRKTFKLSKA